MLKKLYTLILVLCIGAISPMMVYASDELSLDNEIMIVTAKENDDLQSEGNQISDGDLQSLCEDEFDRSAALLMELIIEVVSNHPNLASTLILNMDEIRQAHNLELCLAWMQLMDINYTTDAKESYSSGKYRIININCPVDVKVYDEKGNIMTTIIDDNPQTDAQLMASYNQDGEKLVYLPVTEGYIVKLTATDDGVMNYGVQEIGSQIGESNHLINFNDIVIKKGQEYTGYIPEYSIEEVENQSGEATQIKYTLFLGNTEIYPDIELTGEAVFDAYYYIETSSEDKNKGIVYGGGIRQLGDFVKITAIPLEGYEFVGWYVGNELVTKESEYKMRVEQDISLVGKFKSVNKN